MRSPLLRTTLVGWFLFAPLVTLRPLPTVGQDAGTSSTDAPPSAAMADARVAQIRSLVAGSLDPDVEPQALFDVALDDEAALQIELTRVRALLRAVDEAARPPAPPARPRKRGAASELVDAGGLRANLGSVDAALWAQRVELDRARLSFYSLPAERRSELLREHVARREAAQPRQTEEERLAREAQSERARALEAAQTARTESERLVSEELARLISVDEQVRVAHDRFRRAHEEIALRRDTVLGRQRQARAAKAADASEADAAYDALRRVLRAARDDLSLALDALNDSSSEVPALGANPLVELPTDAVQARRASVERAIAAARREEQALREARAAALLDEINTLNRERLGLLASLSIDKLDATTGFTAAGWDQASSEARHLSLILRYHQHVAVSWIRGVQSGSAFVSPWKALAVSVPLLLAVMAFLWSRRRVPVLLRWGEARLAAADRAEGRTTPGARRRAVRILSKTHRPLEWTIFFLCVLAVLPRGAQMLLEVQLLSSIVAWALAGALIVNTINALASGGATSIIALDEGEAGKLRLRSLRLVGRTVIVFALILVLTARLVGEGTIYRWVFSTCWFAAVPVFLLLVRWWRELVFERLDRIRKKTPLQAWILANRSGWKSFAAAMIGAVQLFAAGAIKLVRGWLSDFDLARRIHAYLFKREIERIGEGRAHAALSPLPADAMQTLHPERAFAHWLSCANDGLCDALVQRAAARRGGLVVLVGFRGMGKTSLLRAAAQQVPRAVFLDCRGDLALEDQDCAMIVVDDAHVLIEPRIGGLARFDELLVFARAHCARATWVFAIDAAVWPLLKRARDARPIFDEVHVLSPWDEKQLGTLIAQRSAAAGISPNFDDLLDKLPAGSDELDRQDALLAKRAGYERMLWDHVGGNPGLALEVWRASLGRDQAGVDHVRPLQAPDITELERLPDSSLFVLRAILQLAPTTAETVAQATRLRPDEVLQDIRFGQAQGFYEEQAGQVRVAWPWLRAVSRLLERRHLLVSV